jgi:hypothetical protein
MIMQKYRLFSAMKKVSQVWMYDLLLGIQKKRNFTFQLFSKFASLQSMKTISFVFILLLTAHLTHASVNNPGSSSQGMDSVIYVRRIMIIGDSHLMGYFGESLQLTLHAAGHYDILSIAIGGAGSRNFTMTMRNNCCGYKIRESFYDETFDKKNRIRTLEACNYLSGEIVGKIYKGQLSSVLHQFDPHIVIIALGHNYINDHQNLINIFFNYSKTMNIVWVGPFLNRGISQQMYAINKVVQQNNLFLVRSDDIIGSDTASCAHYYGRAVDKWTAKVVDRMAPVIHAPEIQLTQFHDMAQSYTWDTLPFFLRYIDDKLFMIYENHLPKATEILIPASGMQAYRFSPRYLGRLFAHHFIKPVPLSSVSDIDGNMYPVFNAGNSVWMASNLKTSRYIDGTPIEKPGSAKPFFMMDEPAVYFSHPNFTNEQGYLYSWYAVAGNKKICPEGWHVPDVSEIMYLKQFVDSKQQGFNPSAWMNSDGRLVDSKKYFYMWSVNSVDDETQSAWISGIEMNSQSFIFLNRNKKQGFPVRCVRD